SDAQLVTEFTTAQQAAAQLEPTLFRMVSVLQPGLEARNEEESPRWQAGFDLAMGRALAQKVRTETYNAMLAKGKRGMAFTDSKNNTWVLKASDEISVGSKWQREAEMARKLLKSVVAEHGGTPWALLAQQELAVPIGWQWVDEFTDLTPSPRRQMRNNNNNPPRPARDDQKRMIQRRPTRPVPKL
ncbi:MAG: VWA domain-containing protein, partial [Planctomycetota bacterium]